MAENIIPFPIGRVVEAVEKKSNSRAVSIADGKMRGKLLEGNFGDSQKMGQIIDRREFHHWMNSSLILSNSPAKLRGQFAQMRARMNRIKIAFENGHSSEVITQSARLAVLAEELGLPRTADLAVEIGETLMARRSANLERLIHKLDSIIDALRDDLFREAK